MTEPSPDQAPAKKAIPRVERPKPEQGGSSLQRMLSVLDLFTLEEPIWAAADILEQIQTTRSTGYRYIKNLSESGLLSAVGNGHYILGPRVIEMDFQIRQTDPLLKASEGVLEEVAGATQYSVWLCTLFQQSVLCVDYCVGFIPTSVLIDRGQRLPLFRSAMSKVIMANLANHQLRNIHGKRAEELKSYGLGEDWAAFKDYMAAIRSEGYAFSDGELVEGISGLGAPIFNAEGAVLGSVGLAWDNESAPGDIAKIAEAVVAGAKVISQRLAETESGTALGRRAVGA